MPDPTAQFIHDGLTIDYTPEEATPAGTVVVIDSLIGVTKQDLAAGERGAIAVTGVYDFPKPVGSNTGSGAGINVYWDDSTQEAKKAAAAGTVLLGKTILAADDDDPTFRVRLTQ